VKAYFLFIAPSEFSIPDTVRPQIRAPSTIQSSRGKLPPLAPAAVVPHSVAKVVRFRETFSFVVTAHYIEWQYHASANKMPIAIPGEKNSKIEKIRKKRAQRTCPSVSSDTNRAPAGWASARNPGCCREQGGHSRFGVPKYTNSRDR
jgi:hypothetical protein